VKKKHKTKQVNTRIDARSVELAERYEINKTDVMQIALDEEICRKAGIDAGIDIEEMKDVLLRDGLQETN